MLTRVCLCLVLAMALSGMACTSGPSAPTPERYYTDAKNNLATQDLEAALTNLDRMIKAAGEQPLGQQGTMLRTALLTAMAEGTKQMAEAYGSGVKQPPASARVGQFTKMRADYHGIARVRLMNAMEAVMGQRSKLSDKSMPLEVSFPAFSGAEHAAIAKIKSGYWAEEGDRYRAELESVRNALALTLARIAGAGEDVNKGQATFSKGGVEIDPRVYLIELSNAFLRLSEIFNRGALDDPRYRRISLEVIRDNMDVALKLLAAKPDKDLEARAKKIKTECEKQLKAFGT